MKHPANFGEYTPRNNAERHRRDPSHPARHHRRPAALLLRLGRRQSPDPHVPLLPPRPRRHRPRHPRDHPPAPTRTRPPPRHPRRRLTTQDEAGRPTRRHGHLRRGGCALLRWWSRGRSHRLADRVWTRRALPSASRWDRPPTEVRPLLTWSARIRERSRRRSTVFRITRAAAGSPRGGERLLDTSRFALPKNSSAGPPSPSASSSIRCRRLTAGRSRRSTAHVTGHPRSVRGLPRRLPSRSGARWQTREANAHTRQGCAAETLRPHCGQRSRLFARRPVGHTARIPRCGVRLPQHGRLACRAGGL